MSEQPARPGDGDTLEVVTDRESRRLSFGSVAADYDRYRPAPPPQALDWLIPPDATAVLDLAAGTGAVTRLLIGRAARVVAVEPDERMRAVLAARCPEAEVLEGRGEDIPLPDASVDAVVIASAWHWLDPDRAVPEITRVLRPGGNLGVIWVSRDSRVGWVAEFNALMREAREADRAPDRPSTDTSADDARGTAKRSPGDGNYLESDTRAVLIDWEQAQVAPRGLDLARAVFIALLQGRPFGLWRPRKCSGRDRRISQQLQLEPDNQRNEMVAGGGRSAGCTQPLAAI